MSLNYFCTMKYLNLLLLFWVGTVSAQVTISGKIKSNDKPIENANISLVNTYDGDTSDADGNFSFITYEKGEFTIKIEHLNYDIYEEIIEIKDNNISLSIELIEVVSLDDIVFTAGEMSAKAETNKSLLKPLDVVTTAGSMGDNIGALQKLPGTQNVAEDGRLFVRGGDPFETSTYIDGLKVHQAYTSSAPNTPVRGRFSPFLFKGINFSTGGFGASYGDAMSGALNMNTINFPKQNSIDISILSVSAGAGVNRKWENQAVSFNLNYFDLRPYNKVFKSRDKWEKSPKGLSGEMVYRKKWNKTLFKTYVAYDFSKFKLIQKNINYPKGVAFALNNNNLYVNSNLTSPVSKSTDFFIGTSFSKANNQIEKGKIPIKNDILGNFWRLEFNTKFNTFLKFKYGTSFNFEKEKTKIEKESISNQNALLNIYTEAEWSVTHDFAVRPGLRFSYANDFNDLIWQPRLSMAYKLNSRQNLAFAYGIYGQSPKKMYINNKSNLEFQKAQQYSFNYLYQSDKNILRAEIYHKKYDDLITFSLSENGNYSQVHNSGYGKANGLDVFWRNDNDLIQYLDFWISYSYIDSKRKYKDYPYEVQPEYTPNHTFSWVGKYWINSIRSQLGLTYSFSSGRPYTNKNTDKFLSEKTKNYHSVDLAWSYLISQQKILYVGVNNIFNTKNVFGYRYANMKNIDGFYEREPIKAQNNQFFVVGFFWTISTDKSKNQLDKL